jgi:hypothetical protein
MLSKRIKKLESIRLDNEERLLVIICKGQKVRQQEEFGSIREYKKYLDSNGFRYVSV